MASPSREKSACSDTNEGRCVVEEKQRLEEQQINCSWEDGIKHEHNQSKLHLGTAQNLHEDVKDTHNMDMSRNRFATLEERIAKLEERIEMFMFEQTTTQGDLPEEPDLDSMVASVPPSATPSLLGPTINLTAHEHMPKTSAEQLNDEQKKIVAARELLLEVASYHGDCLKQVLESVESLAVRMSQMDIMIKREQLALSEDRQNETQAKGWQSLHGEVLSEHSTDNNQESITLKTFESTIGDLEDLKANEPTEVKSVDSQTRAFFLEELDIRFKQTDVSMEEFGSRLKQTDTSMQSAIQRVEDMDKKLELFFTSMMKSTTREIADLEAVLRAEIERCFAGHPPGKGWRQQASAAGADESAPPLFSFVPRSNQPHDSGDGRRCDRRYCL